MEQSRAHPMPGRSIEVIEAEESKIWITSTDGLETGMTVEQENYVGRLTDLLQSSGKNGVLGGTATSMLIPNDGIPGAVRRVGITKNTSHGIPTN